MEYLGGGGSYADIKRAIGHRTDIESIVEAWLVKYKIEYEFELQCGRYSIDFAIPSIMVAIECDCEYWHDRKKDRDDLKTTFLESKGWIVVRLPGKTIMNGDFENTLFDVMSLVA